MTAIDTSSVPVTHRRSGLKSTAKRAVRATINGCVERYLRIDTTSLANQPCVIDETGDAIPYEPLDYPFLLRTLRTMDLNERDVVYEVGCGMGRVMCLLARRRLARCVGIELSDTLADRARTNLAAVRGRQSPATVVTSDAALADYTGGSALFMFHPFGPATMRQTLARVRASLDAYPRPLRIMYVNPFHEDVLESSGWLTCRARLRSRLFNTYASYWFAGDSVGEGHDQ